MMQYDNLPDVLKAQIARHEWAWLSDAERQRFVQGCVEPEAEDIDEDD